MKHNTCPGKYFIIPLKCVEKSQGLLDLMRILVAKWHPLKKSPKMEKANIGEEVNPAPLRRRPPLGASPPRAPVRVMFAQPPGGQLISAQKCYFEPYLL